jgi:hypothetical protein
MEPTLSDYERCETAVFNAIEHARDELRTLNDEPALPCRVHPDDDAPDLSLSVTASPSSTPLWKLYCTICQEEVYSTSLTGLFQEWNILQGGC